jgi:hypothetical protein
MAGKEPCHTDQALNRAVKLHPHREPSGLLTERSVQSVADLVLDLVRSITPVDRHFQHPRRNAAVSANSVPTVPVRAS